MTDEAAIAAARAAGWTGPGPAPFEHSPYIAPLAESLDLDDLIDPETGEIR